MFEQTLNMIEQGLNDKIFPSAALAVGVRDRVLLNCCCGNTSLTPSGIPVTSETLYDIASLTKIVVTSMIAFHLFEEKLLRLDDTLDKFFETPDDKKSITIRQLMTHSSGITSHFYLSKYAQNPEETVKAILNYPLACPTASKVIYSCMGFILLGKILEQCCGSPLDKLSQKYVFNPLSMTNTTYHPAGSNIAYTNDPQTNSYLCGTVQDENARFLGGVSGNAGIFSTLDDMIKLTSMLSCGGKTANGTYLSPETIRLATQNYTPSMAQNRGLGFKLMRGELPFMGELFGARSFGHTGFTGTSIAVDPDRGLFVVLLTNRVHLTLDNSRFKEFRQKLHDCIASEYFL
ncbi:MAG: serine hydrolase domain-containing protein [Bacillota bacterium]|nr:serine hydrolase domain-containing protein [Bacillota bacterium]